MLIHDEQELLANKRDIAESLRRKLDVPSLTQEGNERLKLVFDLEMHFAFLAEAVRCRVNRIFIEYIVWTHQLLLTCNGDSPLFRDCLAAMGQYLRSHGRGDWVETACDYLQAAMGALDSEPRFSGSVLNPDDPHHALAKAFLDDCLSLDRNNALERIHRAVEQCMSIHDVYLHVITPAMHELGRLWQLNKITIGHEHYCTAVAQMVMAQLFPWIFDGKIKHKRMVVTCVAGELHEIGARMVSDLFEINGWDTVFLGADVPVTSVIDTLIQHDAHVLAISATLGANLWTLSDMIATVRTDPACAKLKVLVGGSAFKADPSLWQTIGADGWANDPMLAVSLADSWVEHA